MIQYAPARINHKESSTQDAYWYVFQLWTHSFKSQKFWEYKSCKRAFIDTPSKNSHMMIHRIDIAVSLVLKK